MSKTISDLLHENGVLPSEADKAQDSNTDAGRIVHAGNFLTTFIEDEDQPPTEPTEQQIARQKMLSRMALDTLRAKSRVTHAEYAQKHGARTGWRERKEAREQARRRRTMHIGGSRA